MTFTLAQASTVQHADAARSLVRTAAACSERTLVKSAGACGDLTSMPLEVTLLADGTAGAPGPSRPAQGRGTRFKAGHLRLAVGGVGLSAVVLPDGTARDVSGHSDGDHTLEVALVRIAR